MDNYDNFIFYGSWRKVLEGIASSQGKDYAKEVLWNIMLMSTAGDIETDDPFIINFIEGVILPVVDAARERYDRAKKGGVKRVDGRHFLQKNKIKRSLQCVVRV